MQKIIILTLILSLICFSQAAIQFEQGEHTGINIPENVDYSVPQEFPKEQVFTVNFNQKFDRVPQVAITLSQLGWYSVDYEVKNTEYKVYLKEVTTSGFTYALYQNFESLFYRLVIQYAASNDPFFQVYYLDMGQENEAKTVTFSNIFSENPSVTAFVLGASHIDSDAQLVIPNTNKIFTNVTNIQKDSCIIKFVPGIIYSGNIVVIALPTSRAAVYELPFATAQTKLNLQSSFTKTIIGKTFTVPVPSGHSSSFQLFGIAGYEFKVLGDMRSMLWNKTMNAAGTSFTIEQATWGRQMDLQKMKFAVVFYQPKDECAFLFTECEYKGNYAPVCPDVHQPSFSATPFKDNDVKSIYIPENKKVTLFELENFEGMEATFDTSQNCIAEVKGKKQVAV